MPTRTNFLQDLEYVSTDIDSQPRRPVLKAETGVIVFGSAIDWVEPSDTPVPDELREAVESLMKRFSLRQVVVDLREPLALSPTE